MHLHFLSEFVSKHCWFVSRVRWSKSVGTPRPIQAQCDFFQAIQWIAVLKTAHLMHQSVLACRIAVSLVAAAQTAAPASQTATPQAATAGTNPKPVSAPSANDKAAMEVAFSRADTNGDRKLSKEETARMPAIASTFGELDTNKHGGLNMHECSMRYMSAVN